MLPPPNRLRRTADVGRVRQHGRRWQHPLVTLFVYTPSEESLPASRFAFAVGRHIGKATRRNRVRRRIREVVRRQVDRIVPGYDCLFVARPGALTAAHEELEQAIVQLLTRGGLIVNEKSVPESGGAQT